MNQPVAVDFATVLPELRPNAFEVNIGAECVGHTFGVGDVFDEDGEVLSFRFFMLFEDPGDPTQVRRQELASSQLQPLESEPTRYPGPFLTIDERELDSEFPFVDIERDLTNKQHLLQLVIADRPFIGDVDDAKLPEDAQSVVVAWPFVVIDSDCTTEVGP